jgi:hypothetical protein
MRMKRKIIISGLIATLASLVLWSSTSQRMEVHGGLSRQDVADLTRLGHVERKRDLIDWSPTPQPWDIHAVPYKWRRYKFNSAPVVRIDQTPDNKAEVTIGTGSLMRRYQFVNTKQGWQRPPVIIE